MTGRLFYILSVIFVCTVWTSCTKKQDIPSDASPDVISWIKPIEFRGQNISVKTLTKQPNGGFLASGGISYPGKELTDGFVINLNSEGDTVWCKKVSIEFFPNTDVFYATRISNDEIVISGVCNYAYFKKQLFVAWLNGAGTLTKYVLFPMENNQVVNWCRLMPVENGNIYFAVFGSTGQDAGSLESVLNIDLLGKGGNLIRRKTLTGIQTNPESLYLVDNENLLLVGSVAKDFPDYADFLFLLLDSSGNEKYRRTFGTAGYDIGYSACSDGKGGYIMACMTTNLSRPSLYRVNSSGIVSNGIVLDDKIFGNATIILPSGEGYNVLIQSASALYFKKLGNDLVEEKSWVISNPNPAYNIHTALPETDGSISFLYNNGGPVIVKTIPLN